MLANCEEMLFQASQPDEVCFTNDAFKYESDSEVCNNSWRDWDAFCSNDWTDECEAVETSVYHIMAQNHKAPQPDEFCYTVNDDNFEFGHEVCNDAWFAWNRFCSFEWTDECDLVELEYAAAKAV